MSDKRSIEHELSINLESYTSNLLLNKLTPGKKGPTNSRNILTSPVKTLRRDNRKNNNDDDSNDTTTRSNIIPLNDKSKSPLRKGTPKITQGFTKSKSPVAHDDSKFITSFKSRSLIGANVSRNILPEDEFDDDDEIINNDIANSTLLDEIPSDLLSPEKHVYPAENISRNSITSTPKLNLARSQQIKKDKPSNPEAPTPVNVDLLKQPSTSKSPRKISMTNESISSATKPQIAPGKSSSKSTPVQPNKPGSTRPAFSIFKDGSPVEQRIKSINDSVNKDTSVFNDNSTANSLHPESFIHRVTDTSMARRRSLVKSAHHKRVSPEDSPDNELLELQNRVIEANQSIIRSGTEDNSTVQATTNNKRFDSDDEELHVPELTSTKFGDILIDANLLKRKRSELEPFDKKPDTYEESLNTKKTKLYPDLNIRSLSQDKPKPQPHQSANGALLTSSFTENVQPNGITGQVLSTSLYPNLERYKQPLDKHENSNGLDNQDERTFELIETVTERLKNRTTSTELTSKTEEGTANLHSTLHPEEPESSSQAKENLRPREPHLQVELGEPENWTKPQWKRFLKTLKIYKRNHNNLSVFTPDIMKFLKCDLKEIKYKISFAMEYSDELKHGFKKEY